MQKQLGRKAVSTAVASIAALVTVLAISAMASAMLFNRASAATGAVSERLSRAGEKIPVRLSTVYHVPPILVVSNDGVTPVEITRLYLDGSPARELSIVLRPGEKAPLEVGYASRVAVEVAGWGVVVLRTVTM